MKSEFKINLFFSQDGENIENIIAIYLANIINSRIKANIK